MKKLLISFMLIIYSTSLFAAELVPKGCNVVLSDYSGNSKEQTYTSPDGKITIKVDRSQYRKDDIVKIKMNDKTLIYGDVFAPIFMNNGKDTAFLAYKNVDPYETVFVKNNVELVITGSISYNNNGSPYYYSDGANMVYIIEEKRGNKKLYKNDKALAIDLNKYSTIKDLTMSANGETIAFIAVVSGDDKYKEVAVINGIEDNRFSNTTNLTLSPDGKRAIYNAYDDKNPQGYITVVDGKIMKNSSLVCGTGKIYFSQNSKSYICEGMDRKTGKIAVIKDGIDIGKGKLADISNVEYLLGTTSYTFLASMINAGNNYKTILVKDGKIIQNNKYEAISGVQQLNDNKNIAYIGTKTVSKNNLQGVIVVKGKELVSLPLSNLINYPRYNITGLTLTNKDTGKDFIVKFIKEVSANQYKDGLMICQNIQ